MATLKILLLSAYDTDSHRSWCQGLMTHLPQFDWEYLSLPGRYFSWRIRGNPLSFAYGDNAHKLQQDYDLVIATSMVDLATLRGLIPKLANTPCLLYFHENQFAYPKSEEQHASIEPQMVNLYSALSANKVVFNSHYNQQSFLNGIRALLKKLPDHAPLNAIESIEQKSQVLPVPINIEAPNDTLKNAPNKGMPFQAGETLRVIWNHRWEYDKGPATLAQVIALTHGQNANIHFSVCGMSFRRIPEAFQTLQANMPDNLLHMGTYPKRHDYLLALTQHHVVLSTAIHEFQGLSMLEGASQGCVPLAPNRLAYPEWIPQEHLYPNTHNQEAQEILKKLIHWQSNGLPKPIPVNTYSWQKLADRYASTIEKTAKLMNKK